MITMITNANPTYLQLKLKKDRETYSHFFLKWKVIETKIHGFHLNRGKTSLSARYNDDF